MRIVAGCLALALPLAAWAEEIPAHFPMHPLEAERRMRDDAIEILSAKRTVESHR